LAFDALDLKAKAAFEHLSNRYLVTSHAAFGYFAARYNLTQVALNGISPEDSPSPKEVEEVIATIRAYDVKTIYGEEMVSDSILSSIKEATGAEMKELYTIESRPEEGELDYIAMFESNIMTIQEGNR
jgi:zinc transport system substrate-binding protein